MKEIEIIIHPDGQTDIEVKGCTGPECETLTKDVETALGPVTRRRRKAEFYQKAPASHQVEQRHE